MYYKASIQLKGYFCVSSTNFNNYLHIIIASTRVNNLAQNTPTSCLSEELL